MTEQWFLDLDGVRSGPYQTPEVMSLVAEGEVLPHHRISRGLKDQKWITILDWRLNQAKASAPGSPLTQNKGPLRHETLAEESSSLPLEMPTEASVIEVAPPKPEAIEPPKEATAAIQEKMDAVDPPGKTKRDPTAEMFDMLQNTKQRREAKSSKAAGITVEPDVGSPSENSGFMKIVLVGLGIVFLGFGLGQLFQSSNTTPPVVEVKITPTPAPRVEAKVEKKTEVIDRSNEKMTIRAKVERNMEATKPPPMPGLPPAAARPEPNRPAAIEKRVNDKEMEELKDLKRELQELKALKDQNNPNDQANEEPADANTSGQAGENGPDPAAPSTPDAGQD